MKGEEGRQVEKWEWWREKGGKHGMETLRK